MTRLERIADLLMGAAHSDGHVDASELQKVKELLRELSRKKGLAPSLERRLDRFRPSKFNLAAVCSGLSLTTDEQKRGLLELVVKVLDADDVWDLDEDAYLRKVASAIGAPDALLDGLAIEGLSLDSLAGALLDDSEP